MSDRKTTELQSGVSEHQLSWSYVLVKAHLKGLRVPVKRSGGAVARGELNT